MRDFLIFMELGKLSLGGHKLLKNRFAKMEDSLEKISRVLKMQNLGLPVQLQIDPCDSESEASEHYLRYNLAKDCGDQVGMKREENWLRDNYSFF